MKKRELAAGLGISTTMVSRLEQRGMPTTSLEAAKRWRAANLDPCRTKAYRADGNTGMPIRRTTRGAPARKRQAASCIAGFDHFEREVLPRLAVLLDDEALAIVTSLGRYAKLLLAEGKFDDVRAPLQAALRAVPNDRRDELSIDVQGTRFATLMDGKPSAAHSIPADVWEALLKDLIDRCNDEKTPPTAREHAEAEASGDAAFAANMYGFAAGEWVLGPA